MTLCPELHREALSDALNRMRDARVALIGDFCLDLYWIADMRLSELSRETPHYPLPVVSERHSPGGAGNVACNLAALQPAKLAVLGLAGRDWRGELLRADLIRAGVNTDSLIASDEITTNAYVKPIRTGISKLAYEDPRIDFENRAPISPALEEALCREMAEAEFDVLLVSDQMRFGAVTRRVREAICRLGAAGKTVIVDSRDRAGEYRDVIVKPNEVEAMRLLGRDEKALCREELVDFALEAAGEIARINRAPAVITLGEMGCVVNEGGASRHCPGAKVTDPVDIVGAGDTFLSALGCALGAGLALDAAARIACLASSVTIRKLGTTGTASPQEILGAYEAAGASEAGERR